jgi:hypothetical protein
VRRNFTVVVGRSLVSEIADVGFGALKGVFECLIGGSCGGSRRCVEGLSSNLGSELGESECGGVEDVRVR